MHTNEDGTNVFSGDSGSGITTVTLQSEDRASLSSNDRIPLLRNGRSSGICGACGSHKDVLAALIACLGAVSMGLVLGYSNPALLNDSLVNVVLENDQEKISWFGSLVAIGAIVGGPVAALGVGRCGRKTTLMLCNVPMGIGWFMIAFGYHYALVFCGRILTGVAMGMVSLSVPLYIAEVASKERRGLLGAGFQLFVTIGVLGVYALGIPLSWNWLAIACLSISALNMGLLIFVPETPRWFIMQGRRDGALDSLAWFFGNNKNLEEEYNEIERNLASQSNEGIKFRDVAHPGIYKPMFICFGLMVFQQMSGINVVIFYSSQIFSKAGFASNPAIPTIVIGAVLVAATVVSCMLMDLAGRRVLLLISGILMTLSITALAVYYYLTEVKLLLSLSWLSLTSVLVFVIAFSLGWGPIPWLVTSEIIPARARGVVNSLATCVNWLLVFVITKEFQQLAVSIHDYGAFWFFGAFCLAGCCFVFAFLPETKGRSLEEIQQGFAVHS